MLLAELLPRRRNDPQDNFKVKWTFPLLNWSFLGRRRQIHDGAQVHRSVELCMQAGIGYSPPSLPDAHVVLTENCGASAYANQGNGDARLRIRASRAVF
jgi:hypothetical protein